MAVLSSNCSPTLRAGSVIRCLLTQPDAKPASNASVSVCGRMIIRVIRIKESVVGLVVKDRRLEAEDV